MVTANTVRDLQAQIELLQQTQQQELDKRHRKHKKSHSHKSHKPGHQKQRYYYSSDSTTDSERGSRPIVSFIHDEIDFLSASLGHGPPNSWYKQTSLPREAARLLWWGLVTKTRTTYSTSAKSYDTHCALNDLTPYSATTNALAD